MDPASNIFILGTPPKFNSEFTPEKMMVGRRSGFLLGPGNFSGAMFVKLQECISL